jgi:16S rRNA (guanine527-N7)-methyltransferase
VTDSSGTGPGLPVDPTELRERVTDQIELILRHSAELGFLGSMPIADQIDHALGFVVAAELALGRSPVAVADLGSGGGVPGLILLACWPTARLVLLDSNERRTEFLSEATETMTEADFVEVIRGRAEEIGRSEAYRQRFDLVTSRSFGAPAVTAECGAPLLSMDGVMVVSEPPDGEDRWPTDALLPLGLVPTQHVRFEDRFGYQVLRKEWPTPDRYPRRTGIPAKRPLF